MQALPHPLRVSLKRARSPFRPLLPSACYAGYLTASHAQRAIMCELAITSIDKSRDFTWKNLTTVAADDQNGPGLWELPNKMVLMTINYNCNYCGHCYISR